MSISTGSKILASDVNNHINNKSNPHSVTASQIGAATTSALAVLEAAINEMEGENDMTIDLQGYSYYTIRNNSWTNLSGGYEYIIFPYEGNLKYGAYQNDTYYVLGEDQTSSNKSPSPIKIIVPSSGISLALASGFVYRKTL